MGLADDEPLAVSLERLKQVLKARESARLKKGSIQSAKADSNPISRTSAFTYIGTHQVPVRLAWTSTTAGGKFKGRQPENLTAEEWQQLQTPCSMT